MARIRSLLIELSDVVGARLTQGGSVLSKTQMKDVLATAQDLSHQIEELMEWERRGGYWPRSGR